jgi:glycosyltransferase
MPPHPTLFLKKEVYEKYGLFDLSYKISADYDFILRIFKDTELKFGYLPKVVTKMRVGGASNRSLKNIIKKSKEDYRAIRTNNVGNLLTLVKKNTSKLKQFF